MPDPSAGPADARPGRDAVVARLRALLAAPALPVAEAALSLGDPALDAGLPGGGLAAGRLHEVAPATDGDAAAALGFVAALLARVADAHPGGGPGDLLLVAVDGPTARHGSALHGSALHGHGLAALGLDPARLLVLDVAADGDALWALAEALRTRAVRAAAGILGGPLALRESRRLGLAAEAAGATLVVLRPAGADRPNAAATRWRVAAAPAARDAFDLITGPRWRVDLERARNGRPGRWLVEWDHAAHRFGLARELADPALPEGSARRAG